MQRRIQFNEELQMSPMRPLSSCQEPKAGPMSEESRVKKPVHKYLGVMAQ